MSYIGGYPPPPPPPQGNLLRASRRLSFFLQNVLFYSILFHISSGLFQSFQTSRKNGICVNRSVEKTHAIGQVCFIFPGQSLKVTVLNTTEYKFDIIGV